MATEASQSEAPPHSLKVGLLPFAATCSCNCFPLSVVKNMASIITVKDRRLVSPKSKNKGTTSCCRTGFSPSLQHSCFAPFDISTFSAHSCVGETFLRQKLDSRPVPCSQDCFKLIRVLATESACSVHAQADGAVLSTADKRVWTWSRTGAQSVNSCLKD